MLPSRAYRNEPVLVMSSLLQPAGPAEPLGSGVNVWRFERQQAELACHLGTDFVAHCVLVTSGMVAAAGQSLALPRYHLAMLPCTHLHAGKVHGSVAAPASDHAYHGDDLHTRECA